MGGGTGDGSGSAGLMKGGVGEKQDHGAACVRAAELGFAWCSAGSHWVREEENLSSLSWFTVCQVLSELLSPPGPHSSSVSNHHLPPISQTGKLPQEVISTFS